MLFRSIISESNLTQMVELVKTLPEGDFAEVGVFRGGSAAKLYGVCLTQNRNLHLFDTFTGTPVHTEGLDKHKIDSEFLAENTPDYIKQLMPFANVYQGIYPTTHPENLGPLAFIHCDCDQYLSYLAVIDHMWPLVVPGGVLLFDDYPYLLGAKQAVEENFPISSLKYCGTRAYVIKEVVT